MSENTGRKILIEEEVKNSRSYASVAKHNMTNSTSEIPKVLAPTLNKPPGLHGASEYNQVTAHEGKPTRFGCHQRSVGFILNHFNRSGHS